MHQRSHVTGGSPTQPGAALVGICRPLKNERLHSSHAISEGPGAHVVGLVCGSILDPRCVPLCRPQSGCILAVTCSGAWLLPGLVVPVALLLRCACSPSRQPWMAPRSTERAGLVCKGGVAADPAALAPPPGRIPPRNTREPPQRVTPMPAHAVWRLRLRHRMCLSQRHPTSIKQAVQASMTAAAVTPQQCVVLALSACLECLRRDCHSHNDNRSCLDLGAMCRAGYCDPCQCGLALVPHRSGGAILAGMYASVVRLRLAA